MRAILGVYFGVQPVLETDGRFLVKCIRIFAILM